ncbi:MAG: prepilin peptidase [Candidatus Pacearchaeota archaeon]
MEILFAGDILLFIISFLALIFATITDIKRTEVPNWLSFSLLAAAFAIRTIAALLSLQFFYLYYAIIAFMLFFILSNVFLYGKFFGGGDAKLLIALAVAFATTPPFVTQASFFTEEPFLLGFFINTFVIGSVYSLFFIAFFAIKNYASFRIEFKKIYRKTKTIRTVLLAIAVIALMASFLSTWFLFIFTIALVFPYIYIIAKATENSSMVRKVSPKVLTEGDWLVEKVHVKNRLIKPSIHGLSIKEIRLLQKARKNVTIKYGIPFVPVFLISFIATLLFGDLIMLIIRVFFF